MVFKEEFFSLLQQHATLIELIIEPNVLGPALEIGKNIG